LGHFPTVKIYWQKFLCLVLVIAGMGTLGARDLEDETKKLVTLYEEGKYEEVLSMAKRLNEEFPSQPNLLNIIGATYLKQKQYDKAAAEFQAALRANRNFFPAKFNLVEILFVQGKYEEALAQFRELSNQYPRNELIKFATFMCQLKLGQKEEARKTLSKIPYPGQTPAWHYASGAWELNKGNTSKALRQISIGRDFFPEQAPMFEDSFEQLGLRTR